MNRLVMILLGDSSLGFVSFAIPLVSIAGLLASFMDSFDHSSSQNCNYLISFEDF